ncbi:MAG: (2Fe-2S)-binding protein [Alphaproteobacteria bacterium]|nr:(2Fe-2S)-binding protein [Alphaproteobacteria bacterium]
MSVRFQLNGAAVEVDTLPMTRLLDVLREQLGATGAKEGCGEGECGSCTVLLDGEAVCSCLIPVCQVQGRAVTTVEGLARDGVLTALQRAFIKYGAAQCGICTPGFLMTATQLRSRGGPLEASEVREALAGNLCRCTGYQKIIDAVVEALGADQ